MKKQQYTKLKGNTLIDPLITMSKNSFKTYPSSFKIYKKLTHSYHH